MLDSWCQEMCIRASEESLTCATNTTFWSQKTVDILNYPKDKGQEFSFLLPTDS